MKYQLFSPCEMALSGEEPPTFHSQCHGEFKDKGVPALRCSCDCHPWARFAEFEEETTE